MSAVIRRFPVVLNEDWTGIAVLQGSKLIRAEKSTFDGKDVIMTYWHAPDGENYRNPDDWCLVRTEKLADGFNDIAKSDIPEAEPTIVGDLVLWTHKVPAPPFTLPYKGNAPKTYAMNPIYGTA